MPGHHEVAEVVSFRDETRMSSKATEKEGQEDKWRKERRKMLFLIPFLLYSDGEGEVGVTHTPENQQEGSTLLPPPQPHLHFYDAVD